MARIKGYNAHDVLGDDKAVDMEAEISTHTHGLKFTDAGKAGDSMVAKKLSGLPTFHKGSQGKKTSVNLKGA